MAEAPQSSPAGERVHPVKALPFEIKPFGEHQKWLKMLVYGKPGAGKTTLLGSAADVPSMRDILLLDIESGTLTLENNDRVGAPEFIQTIGLKDFATVDLIYQWLQAHCMFRDKGDLKKLASLEEQVTGRIPQKPRMFRTIIVDSVSELDNMSFNKALGIDDDMKIDDDVPGSEWSHYKQNGVRMMLLLRRLRNLPINVLLTCLAKWVQDEHKKFHYGPALTGQLRDTVQGLVDVVGFLVEGAPQEGKEAPRRMYVQPTSDIKCDAKNRWAPYKKSYFDDPTMMSILQAVGIEK